MKKGFNEEYVEEKMNYYEKLALKDEEYEDVLLMYQLLYATLIFQEGTVTHNEVSIEEFLEAYNDTNNLFPIKNRITKNVVRNTIESILKLDSLEKEVISDIIPREDSFAFVGKYIKEIFGEEHFNIYKKYVLQNRDYILFDKHNTNPRIIPTIEGEYFLKLLSSSNIDFSSTLAHECGHLVKKILYGEPIRISFLSEVESFSYELGLLLWMIKNNIYKDEARKRIINLMELLESLTKARYYDNLYSLHSIKNFHKFYERITNNKILEKVNVNSLDDLFNLIGTTIEINYNAYLLSFLVTLEIFQMPNFLERYHYILQNLEKVSDSRFLKTIGLNNITNLNAYAKVRERLRNNCI